MKIITGLIALFTFTHCFGQTVVPNQSTATQTDTASHKVIFFDDFNNNKNTWTIADNTKERTSISGGYYYLTSVRLPHGEAQEMKIDTRKDFEIEARIKILHGNPDHRDYYSMLFWGRKALDSYYFTFAKDGFVSVEICNGIHQRRNCITMKGSLQKTTLDPDGFNVYTIKKIGNTYSFFVNGIKFYAMPFTPFFGNLVGFGAGRKTSLQIDYLKVIYL